MIIHICIRFSLTFAADAAVLKQTESIENLISIFFSFFFILLYVSNFIMRFNKIIYFKK